MARIAIVGTGWGARVQVPTFRAAGHQVAGIAGFHFERTRELALELEVRGFADWRRLVQSPDVDLVSIVTPPSEHLEMTLTALAAGKHVLCEKPTALDAAQAEQMLREAQKRPGQLALIDHELRFLPSWRTARERVGEIGEVRYAEVRYSSPARGDRNRAWNWWSDASRGGGIWGAVGSHFVDALRYFGMEADAALATLRTVIGRRPFEGALREVTSDDLTSVQLRLLGGGAAVMHLSAVASGPDEAAVLTIYGEAGAMRFSGEEVLISMGGSPFRTLAGGSMEARPGNSPGGAFGTGTLHLARALADTLDRGDRSAISPAATFEDGLAQQRVLDAARTSSAGGGAWVPV